VRMRRVPGLRMCTLSAQAGAAACACGERGWWAREQERKATPPRAATPVHSDARSGPPPLPFPPPGLLPTMLLLSSVLALLFHFPPPILGANPIEPTMLAALTTSLEAMGVPAEVVNLVSSRGSSGAMCDGQLPNDDSNPSGEISFSVTKNDIKQDYTLEIVCDPETVADESEYTSVFGLQVTRNLDQPTPALPDGHPGLGGYLHEDLSKLNDMTVFTCIGCGLTGTIPDLLFRETTLAFDSYPKLEILSLAFNKLSGTLPTWPYTNAASQSLDALDLSFNELSGTLPASYLVRDMSILDITNNLLTGQIPPVLGAVFLGTTLYGNRFSGELPEVGENVANGGGCRLVSTGGCEQERNPSLCPDRETNCFRCSSKTAKEWEELGQDVSAVSTCYAGDQYFSVVQYCLQKEQEQDARCNDGVYEGVVVPTDPGSGSGGSGDDDDGGTDPDPTPDVPGQSTPSDASVGSKSDDGLNVPLIAGASVGGLCVCAICIAIAVGACTLVRKSSSSPSPRTSHVPLNPTPSAGNTRPSKSKGAARISRQSSRAKTHVQPQSTFNSMQGSGRGDRPSSSARDRQPPPAFATIGSMAPPTHGSRTTQRRSRSNSSATLPAVPTSHVDLSTSEYHEYHAPTPTDYHAPAPPGGSGYAEPAQAKYDYDLASSRIRA
jgi:hypothetical protein